VKLGAVFVAIIVRPKRKKVRSVLGIVSGNSWRATKNFWVKGEWFSRRSEPL